MRIIKRCFRDVCFRDVCFRGLLLFLKYYTTQNKFTTLTHVGRIMDFDWLL